MTAFANALSDVANLTLTENGAVTNASSKSYILDFFAQGGAFRLGKRDGVQEFARAFRENEDLACKALFYLRDVRGGQGERKLFRDCMAWIAQNEPKVAEQLIKHVPEYGRWDDLYTFVGTPVQNAAFAVVASQLSQDMASDKPSLLAKWLKSVNTSSKVSRTLARMTARALGMTDAAYRKTLAALRKRINILETTLSVKEYAAIDYSKIPSRAGFVYRKAFARNDGVRYGDFCQKAAKGEVKMNAGTLYPYEIVGQILDNRYYSGQYSGGGMATLEAAWKNLPDYFGSKEVDMLVVADTSGSMSGTPLNVSVSLALYAAEHNKGAWNGKFITFSDTPKLQDVVGKTLFEKVSNLANAEWEQSTNLEAVFDLVLRAGMRSKSMVARIVIVSDMEFNAATRNYDGKADATLMEHMRAKFAAQGFKLPELTFWNVAARQGNYPVTMNESNTQLVSGLSASTFQDLIANTSTTPYEYMLKVLGADRYAAIKVAA